MSNTAGGLANWTGPEGKSKVWANIATKLEEKQQIENERNSRCHEHLGAHVSILVHGNEGSAPKDTLLQIWEPHRCLMSSTTAR